MKNKICLVLGAGSSCEYGFPLGSGLREKIINLKNNSDFTKCAGYDPASSILKSSVDVFCNDFLLSGMKSIDAFLARRTEYIEIGKKAIAYILLSSEAEYKLTEITAIDPWYEHFWNKICTEKWEDLNLSHISIITFNYDRSFEKYLSIVIQKAYKKSIDEACKKIAEIRIVHIYGSLGPTLPSDKKYLEYGNEINIHKTKFAASSIDVVRENENSSGSIVEAQELLRDAYSIGFLGFGFDDLNLKRLDIENTCSQLILRHDGDHARKIVASSYRLFSKEVESIKKKIIGRSQDLGALEFIDDNCTNTLRKSGLLDSI